MKRVSAWGALLFAMLVAASAWAVGASAFEVKTADQFRKGKLDDVVVEGPGRLTSAFAKEELLKEDGEIMWSLAVDRVGNIYAGTSHKGKIRVIKGGKPVEPMTVPDAALFATTVGPDGAVYVGGSPSGTVYKNGKVFCKTGESYIWVLLFDGAGKLYAATGPDGKVLRIDAAGVAVTVLDSSDPHIMSLARDGKGSLYAGTSKSGLIYRRKRGGKWEVIYDAAESEIRTMVVDEKDRLYFGTADVKPGGAPSRGPMGIRSAGAGAVPPGPPTSGKTPSPRTPSAPPVPVRDEVSATNAIYRMTPDGSVVKLYSIRGKMILSMLWHKGNLYAGTGNRGDLIRIDSNLDVTVLEKDLEKQVLSLVAGRAGEILMGTGYKGRVIRYAVGFVKEGVYTSEVFDAKFAARFGTISWKGKFPPGTRVEISTQSGNVAKPDASWSEWSKFYLATGVPVMSPGARFIRCRVKLITAVPKNAPQIDELRIAYLTANQPPRIKSVTVKTPREQNKTAKKPTNGKQVTLSWQAEDPNGDTMRYRVEFRMRGDALWRVLEKKTDKTTYNWKTEAVPDGTYEVRIAVTDEPDNPKDSALTHMRVSEPFVVDNTRPMVTLTVRPGPVGAAAAAADVVMFDRTGIITSAEYSLDSGDWQRLLPEDKIFDSQREKAVLSLDKLKPGEHTLTVRAADDSGNVGAGSRTFVVK